MPACASPRSVYAFITAMLCAPAGTKMNTASGLASLTRWMKGAKSGFCSGVRIDSLTCPPPAVNVFLNAASASLPGP